VNAYTIAFASLILTAGAAVLVPCSLALLNHAYPEDRERTHAIGIWAAGASALERDSRRPREVE
jgi:DHA2 family methylenomycin A resistance protein-like MFS transporter